MQISTSIILLSKLKNRFDDFYAEYGCFLWTIIITQALSLIVLTTSESLLYYGKIIFKKWYEYILIDSPSLHSHWTWAPAHAIT